MQLDLTAEQSDLVLRAIESGRVRDHEEAMQQALTLWMERERQLAELKVSLDAAEASLATGQGVVITADGMRSLAEDVITKCAERLAASGHEAT